jgi:hypothetical protein
VCAELALFDHVGDEMVVETLGATASRVRASAIRSCRRGNEATKAVNGGE